MEHHSCLGGGGAKKGLMPHSFQPSLFSKPAVFPGLLGVFWKEGSLERMGEIPLEPFKSAGVRLRLHASTPRGQRHVVHGLRGGAPGQGGAGGPCGHTHHGVRLCPGPRKARGEGGGEGAGASQGVFFFPPRMASLEIRQNEQGIPSI